MSVAVRTLATVLLLLLGACGGGPRGDIAYNPTSFGRPDAPTPQTSIADYKLQALDKFQVTIYRVADLSREYQVEPAGTVNFPLLGMVNVVGMTSNQLAAELTKRYGTRYLENPSVSVQISTMTTSTVTVEGSVRNPQVYPLVGQSNLLEAIAKSGGPDEYANTKRVVVFRLINGQRQAAAFDLGRVREGLDANPTVYGGDIVVVDGSTLRRNLRQALYAVPLAGLFVPLL